MNQFIPWHLKYRPQVLKDLYGQEIVQKSLSNLIGSGKMPHALLFSGPRGTGKTSTARIVAKSLNCEDGPTLAPCGECPACKAIELGNSFDVIEIDAASNNGVDQIRELIASSMLAPIQGCFRTFVLDEVHMLTAQAQNAFLKTLEEPAPNTLFVLATTEEHRLLDTITSRCLHLRFKPMSAGDIEASLTDIAHRERIAVEDGVLRAIAASSRGGMRDAIQLLYQLSTTRAEGKPVGIAQVYEALGDLSPQQLHLIAQAIASKDAYRVVAYAQKIRERNMEIYRCFESLLALWGDLMALKLGCSSDKYQGNSSLQGTDLTALAGNFELEYLKQSLHYLEDAERRIATSNNSSLWFLTTLLALL
jgi:DNA polymerase-3 subunit gamma/tau